MTSATRPGWLHSRRGCCASAPGCRVLGIQCGLLGLPSRGSCEDFSLQPQPLVLSAQARQLLSLTGGEPAIATAGVAIGPFHPAADCPLRGTELARQFRNAASGPMQLDQLSAERSRIALCKLRLALARGLHLVFKLPGVWAAPMAWSIPAYVTPAGKSWPRSGPMRWNDRCRADTSATTSMARVSTWCATSRTGASGACPDSTAHEWRPHCQRTASGHRLQLRHMCPSVHRLRVASARPDADR